MKKHKPDDLISLLTTFIFVIPLVGIQFIVVSTRKNSTIKLIYSINFQDIVKYSIRLAPFFLFMYLGLILFLKVISNSSLKYLQNNFVFRLIVFAYIFYVLCCSLSFQEMTLISTVISVVAVFAFILKK